MCEREASQGLRAEASESIISPTIGHQKDIVSLNQIQLVIQVLVQKIVVKATYR